MMQLILIDKKSTEGPNNICVKSQENDLFWEFQVHLTWAVAIIFISNILLKMSKRINYIFLRTYAGKGRSEKVFYGLVGNTFPCHPSPIQTGLIGSIISQKKASPREQWA